MENIGELIDATIAFHSKRGRKINGYSREEINALKIKIDKKLPDIYLEYLSKLGKVNSGLNNHVCTSIDSIFKIKGVLDQLRTNETRTEHPIYNEDKMFVFMNDDGWRIFFWYYSDDPNPEIFTYDHDRGMQIERCGMRFLDFMEFETEATTRAIEYLEKRASESGQ